MFVWSCTSWVNLSVTGNEKIYVWLEQDTNFFFLHSDNHDLFSLTFLQTSNIQWDFFVPLHQSFSTHGTVFEVNWGPPCWSKMRVKRGSNNGWEPLFQDQIHSIHCTESASCSWGLEVNILQRQQHLAAVDKDNVLNVKSRCSCFSYAFLLFLTEYLTWK